LQALDLDRRSLVTFTDYVKEGEVVSVYRTFEDAEEERGASVRMRVCRDEDEWWLEAVDAI
jgi:hypothetical protein